MQGGYEKKFQFSTNISLMPDIANVTMESE